MNTILRRITITLCLLFAAPGAAVVYAQDDSKDYARSGFYIGGGGSVGVQDFNQQRAFGTSDADPVAPGLNAKAGVRFHPQFAAELDFLYLDDWDVENFKDANALAFSAKGKGYLYTGFIQPYVSTGIGFVRGGVPVDTAGPTVSTHETAFTATFGGGFDFYATENIVFYVDTSYYFMTGDLNDFSFIPVNMGVQFRF
jgi:hypothetical protein